MAEAQRASEAKTSPRAALLMCADLSEELYSKAARLSRAQEAVIVPLTSAYATSKEQWRFNDKVKRFCCCCCFVVVVVVVARVSVGKLVGLSWQYLIGRSDSLVGRSDLLVGWLVV